MVMVSVRSNRPSPRQVQMAEDTSNTGQQDAVDVSTADPGAAVPTAAQVQWSSIWQLPVLVLGVVMLTVGVFLAMPDSDSDDFVGAMDSVEQYFEANNLKPAEDQLKSIQEHIERGSKQDRARHEVLWGDLAYHRQRNRTWEDPNDHQRVIERYEMAERLGHDFDSDPRRLRRWAETLVALGRPDEQVMPMLDRLPGQPARWRYSLLRQIIEHRRASLPPSPARMLSGPLELFLDEIEGEEDQAERRVQELWGVAVRASLFLEADDPASAVDYLNPRRAALTSRGSDDDLAPLMILMAKAYQRLGENDEAEREYLHAQIKLADRKSDPHHAEILVGLGRISLTKDHDVERALEFFSDAVGRFPATRAFAEALIGLGDSEARRGAHGRACDVMSRTVAHLASQTAKPADQLKALVDTVLTHHQLQLDAGRPELAMDYLSVLTDLYGTDVPADILLRLAATHDRVASDLSGGSDSQTDGEIGTPTVASVFQREIANHFAKAGTYYAEHAEAVTIVDDGAHGDSLWNAARCYDSARQWDKAIQTFRTFAKTRPSDPRHADATRRLALAYQASGEAQTASELLQSIIEKNPHSRHAHRSRVPLARAHVSLKTALSILKEVLNSHDAITPQSAEYREALIELGKLHYHMEEYELACSSLEQAVQRYGELPQTAVLRSYLGDAYRKSVAAIDDDLAGPLVDSRARELRQKRDQRLARAMSVYGEAIAMLESRDESDRSKLEQVMLRNNYFYRADAAYARERYGEAIELYDLAAKRWDNHPATLVALMQIVNAYCAMNQFEDAKAAVNRAQYAFDRMPEDVFDDPNLPITRKHWKDWFRWTAELDVVRHANAGTDP